MKTRATIIGLLGIWLVIAGLLPLPEVIEIWSNFMTGVLVAVLGFSLGRYAEGRHWISGIAGLWTIISAFVPGLHSSPALLINNIVAGAVIMIAGFSVPRRHDIHDKEQRRIA